MILKQTTPPLVDAVPIEELRDHARVTSHDEDNLLSLYLKAAIRYAEEAMRRQLITATWRLTQRVLVEPVIALPRPPLQTITHIKYRDSTGTQQTVADTDYSIDSDSQPGQIILGYDKTWPGSQRGHPNDIEIVFVAGYGDAPADVPETQRAAILSLATHWYEHRQPVITGTIVVNVPYTVDQILWNERCNGFG